MIRTRLSPTLLLALALVPAAVQAEKADRSKPLEIVADGKATVDYAKRVTVLTDNVQISQGTMLIRAERVELRELPNEHRSAVALGVGPKRASFRQKREGLDEVIEGTADRIEYDSRGEVVKFVGNAQVRRLRDGAVADDLSAASIAYDNANETFNVLGTTAAAAPSASSDGRVRMVFTPRPSPPGEPAASEPKR
jgi:lipopolysaccharide export system protein LptA